MSTPSTAIAQRLQTAVNYLQTGQMSAAEQLCQQLCAASPAPADAVHLLAVIYAQTERYDQANTAFLRAINIAPKRGDFQGNYGNLLYEQGRYDEAIHYCQQAIALNYKRPEVHNTLGNAWYKAGQFTEAIQNYRHAITLQAHYAEAHNNLGQALKAQQDFFSAEQCFRQALALQPDFASAANNLKEIDSSLWLTPILSKKVGLHRYSVEAVDFLWDCYHDADFMQLYNRLMPIQFSKAALAKKLQVEAQTHPCQNKAVNWIITTRAEVNALRPIGIANLVEIQLQHRRGEFLIGIPARENRDNGISAAAIMLVLDFAFNRIGLNKLTTYVYKDNTASQKNNLAIGFSQESSLRQQLWHPETSQFIDLYGYGMTLDDFRSNIRLARLSQRLLCRDVTRMP